MSTNKIILPGFGTIKDKDGKTIWGRLSYTFPFTNKEEYLEWRKTWKEMYKELSINLRQEKLSRNESFRKNGEASTHQYNIYKMKNDARTMLEIRKEGKVLSWKMKQENIAK